MANSTADIQKLYIAYFNRPADIDGLAYWAASSMSLKEISNSFAAQKEYKDAYDGLGINQVVNTIYKNMFGHDADFAGLNYWVAEINAGRVTLGTAAYMILAGAKDADKTAIDSKTTAADAFTKAMDTTAEKVAYESTSGKTLAKIWLSKVVDAASLATATAAVDSTLAAIVGGGIDGVTLTNGTDIRDGVVFNAPQVYTPGGDDRINSLQDEDVLTGTGTGATKNVLTATLGNANDNGATTVTPTLNNMDIINVAFTGSGGTAVRNLDLQDATRVGEVNISRVSSISNTARIENLQSVVSKMSVTNSNANNAGEIEFSFGTDVLKGDNTGALTVSNVQVNAVYVGENTSGTGSSGVGLNGYETLTLDSKGAANTIGNLYLPMDTGVKGKLIITGDKNLNLSTKTVIGSISPTVTNNVEATTYAGGVQSANGRISAIDASAFTGNLTLNIGNGILTTGQAETSGVKQNVTITGGKGADHFILADTVETGDSITGGDGEDTLTIVNGGNVTGGATGSSVITKVEKLNVFMNGANSTVAFTKLPDVTGVTVRNIGNDGFNGVQNGTVNFNLTGMTAAQAQAITLMHSTSKNGDMSRTTVTPSLATDGAADTVAVNLVDGVNTDTKFSFTLNAANFENVTIVDGDSESNVVELTQFANHTGTVTLTGGKAGTSINLDVDTAAGFGATVGFIRANVDNGANGQGRIDVANLATEVRLGTSVFDASAEASNVIARFSTNAASATGAQKITTGSGNDVVIFDNQNDNRAGLTISDTVDGGTGSDTLVIDGHLAAAGTIALGASEWTNVSNFETIQLAGANGGATSYKLTLTDTLIAKNNANGVLAIVNDNDGKNNVSLAAGGVDTNPDGTSQESAVTIDAHFLNNTSRFSYKGEEGGTKTADRIIMSDVNLNGSHTINGGAADIDSATFVGNGDTLEVRNNAVVTLGDLEGVSNIGTISFTNDQAVVQTLTLQLDTATVDRLVDSFHSASATEVEVLNIKLNETYTGFTSSAAGVVLDLDASLMDSSVALNITAPAFGGVVGNVAFNIISGQGADTFALQGGLTTAVDLINLNTFGNDTITNFKANGTADKLQLSKALFTALTSVVGNGFSVPGDANIGAAAISNTSAGFIKVDTTGGNSVVYYDADGAGAGVAVLIGTVNGVLAAADFNIIA